jgi:hypothetical protein
MSYVRVVFITVLVLSAALRTQAATLAWDPNPEPDIAGYRVSYGTQSGNHTVSIEVGNVTTYEFLPPQSQRYYIVVQARNTAGLLGPKSNEVMYDAQAPANLPPSLTQPANQSSVQHTSVTLALTATDPEGAPLTFSATGLPPGLNINSATGHIAGTVTTAGDFTVTATVSDGSLATSRTFSWMVSPLAGVTTTVILTPQDATITPDAINHAGERSVLTQSVANRVSYATVMKFDLSQIPVNAVIQSATLHLSLTYVDTATSAPNFRISLHRIINRNTDVARVTGLTADGVNPWTPNACCPNNAPMAQADISPAVSVTTVNRTLGGKTWDALAAVRAWHMSPSTNYGLLLNPDTTVGGTRYRFFASMENGTASNRPYLRVSYTTGATTDTTPPAVAMSAPANNATVSGPSVTVSAAASDANGVAGVQFRVDGGNIGAEDTTVPYSVVWNTTTATNGTHQLTAVARDAAGNVAISPALVVTVNNQTNRPPVLTQPANQTSAEGSAVSVALTATDPDGNRLTYSATGLPPGLGVNSASGLISGTPPYTSAGTYTVTATVSDGAVTHSRSFSWIVTNTNRPPSLEQPADQVSAPGATVSLQPAATDPDGTTLTYQATSLPSGLTVNANSGLISGVLGANATGVHDVAVTVSDGSLTATRTFTWSVHGTDLPIGGDFDGDGRTDLASYRGATGEWRVWSSSNNFAVAAPVVWGVSTDIPVPADYDGDHRTDIAVYRPSTGTWHVLLSSSNMQSSLEVQWGNATDRPLPIDYDNDGRADLALPRFGRFEILLSGSNYTASVTVQ